MRISSNQSRAQFAIWASAGQLATGFELSNSNAGNGLCRIVETKKSFLLAWLNVAADPRISQKPSDILAEGLVSEKNSRGDRI
jgi:hypothetical protein